MTVDIDTSAIDEMFHDPEGPIADIMERKAYAVENAAKRLLLIGGSGGEYDAGVKFFRRGGKLYRWDRAAPHRASAPGEPPASDTGNLLAHMAHRMEDGEQGIEGVIFNDANYAEYLELGTSHMLPRPFLRPALDIGLKA